MGVLVVWLFTCFFHLQLFIAEVEQRLVSQSAHEFGTLDTFFDLLFNFNQAMIFYSLFKPFLKFIENF